VEVEVGRETEVRREAEARRETQVAVGREEMGLEVETEEAEVGRKTEVAVGREEVGVEVRREGVAGAAAVRRPRGVAGKRRPG
jgi:hypothetical protein